VLSGADAVGVAFSVERTGGDSSTLMWVESADDAEHWYFRKIVGDVRPEDRVHNDWPSVASPAAGKRVIHWNASGASSFRLLMREASGSQ
jgi:hypothetical protein